MTAADVLIKIRTMFERKGATEATDALKQTATTAKQTGQQVAQMGRSGSDSMNLMGAASALMRGNLQEAANASIPLLEKTKAMGLSMTQLSLAGALLSTVVAGLRAMSEWANAAALRIAGIQMGNLTNQVNASAEAYGKLLESMNKVTAEKDATLAYNNSMVDSYTRQALAMNEVNKQAELSLTQDESKRREIEAKYADKAASISGMADTQKEAMARKRSFEREQQIEAALAASKERKEELIQEAIEGLNKGQNASSMARKNISFWGDVFSATGQRGTFAEWKKSSEEAGGLTQKSIDSAQAEDARQYQLNAELLELRRMRSVSGVDANTGLYTRSAADIASRTAASDRTRANQEALRPALSELDTEMADLHASDQQSIVAYLREANKDLSLTVPEVKRLVESIRDIKAAFYDANNRDRNRQ